MNLISFVWLMVVITAVYALVFMSLEATLLGVFLAIIGIYIERKSEMEQSDEY